jgi:hypothetical protein
MNPLTPIGHYLLNVLKALSGQLAIKTEAFLRQFVKDDISKLAIDAVVFVQSSMPNADGDSKRTAAVAKLKADLAAAGHDVESFALSTLHWLVETALQSVLAGLAG